ncbi:AAA family ATPase [Thermomonas sp.]|uniref:AAA family ATPase n=1 Tax=Thermomonas sp. TaxID=1971895 RepID=UPI0024892144|nr:AAA family ATPase [Thermomonas sp.]MDI1251710.1 AAA family ATPase [Thermomonas sp.]
MTSIIESADVNILNGTLIGKIDFLPGLNIICGENGTLKTKLLQSLKSEQYNSSANVRPRIQAISPKRNSERRALEQAIQFMRQNNRNYDTYIGEAGGQQLNDRTFANYPSLVELFFYSYDRKCRDGSAPTAHMKDVEAEFNEVVGSVFPEYAIAADWNAAQGRPMVQISKRGNIVVPIEELSLGEQEVLSLITNIYVSKDAYETFLIDEPEVHLNWGLEERLFDFLNDFCEKYEKQMIVVTHSRAVFLPQFINKVQFLVWNEQQRVVPTKEITPDQRRRIAGEAISVLKLGGTEVPTVFVEDSIHELIVDRISKVTGVTIATAQCGTKSNVRSLFKRSKQDGGWSNSLFIEDGDNEGAPSFAGPDFLHLDKYCMENYLLDARVVTSLWSISEEEFRERLFSCISNSKDKILGKNKFLEFLWGQFRSDQLTPSLLAKLDASLVLECFCKRFDVTVTEYITNYIGQANALDLLEKVFPENLVSWIRERAMSSE